jgi:hypothetical protein
MGVEQVVALLYCVGILCGCGMAVMVGDSIRTELQNRRAWRDLDDEIDRECALWADWAEVCGMLGQHPDPRTPLFDAVMREIGEQREMPA